MFTTLLNIALLAALAVLGALADLTVNVNATQLVECQDVKVSWNASTNSGPYLLTLVSPEDPCSNPIANLGDHNYTSMTYKVALAAGTQVQFVLEDTAGDEAWTGNFTVASGSDSSCISQNGATGSTSSGSTLVVTPTTTISVPTPSVSPVGAAGNAGANPLGSGAITMRQASMPILVFAAFATVVVASL